MASELGDFVTGPDGRPRFADSNENSYNQISDNQRGQRDPKASNNFEGLRPEDVEFMEMDQSQDEISVQEQHKKGLLNSFSIGFDRKLFQLQNQQQQGSKISPLYSEYAQSGYNVQGAQIRQTNISNLRSNINQIGDISKINTLDDKAKIYQEQKGLIQYEKRGPEVQFKLEEGRPIKFFEQNHQMEYQISEEAIEEISKCIGHVAFVSITGLKGSGKTFLMNQIIEASNHPSYQKLRQEQGVIIWSQPLYNTLNSSWIFFIDTCLDLKVPTHLELSFIVQLISSAIFVNTKGELNDQSLDAFSSLLKMRDVVKMESEQEVSTAINFNPSLILLLRDFNFGSKQKQVSQLKYFDDFLFDEITYLKATENQKKIRQRILKYFKSRQLIAVNQPVNDSNQLAHLENLESVYLSEEFTRDLYFLRKTILKSTPIKEYKGVFFNATMFFSFINSFLEDIKDKKKLDIQKAFSVLLDNEFIHEYNQCIETYFQILGEQFQDTEFKSIEELQKSLLIAREAATERFYNLRAHDSPEAQEKFDKHYKQLLEVISEKEKKLIQVNIDVSGEFMEEHVSEFSSKALFNPKPNIKFSVGDVSDIEKKFQEQLQFFNSRLLGKGSQYELIGDIAKIIQKSLMESICKELLELDVDHKNEIEKENKEIAKVKEQIVASEKEFKVNLDKLKQTSNDIQSVHENIQTSKNNKIPQLQRENEALIKEKERLFQEQQIIKKKASVKCGCLANDLRKYEQKSDMLPAQQQQQGRS